MCELDLPSTLRAVLFTSRRTHWKKREEEVKREREREAPDSWLKQNEQWSHHAQHGSPQYGWQSDIAADM